jgi:glycosyltransferase involved in cell wall biosynthesis
MRGDFALEPRLEPQQLPPVSVIIALYNAQAFLVECLDSVAAQTYRGPIEICVHDDASTDDSFAVLEAWEEKRRRLCTEEEACPLSLQTASFPISVVVGQSSLNGGAGACRNAAVRASSGSVLIIQVGGGRQSQVFIFSPHLA